MKKLMIVAAVALAAACSQAAQMKWCSDALKAPGTTSSVSSSYGGKGYLININPATYATITAAIADMDGNAASKYIYDLYSAKLSDTEVVTKSSTAWSSGKNTITDPGTYVTGGAPSDAYAVIIYTAYGNTEKTGDLYYIANIDSWHFAADTTKTMYKMGNTLGGEDGTKAISWQTASVPEPTSAMLLLLGMAGLALKRKRA